jgi:hypothetical protein
VLEIRGCLDGLVTSTLAQLKRSRILFELSSLIFKSDYRAVSVMTASHEDWSRAAKSRSVVYAKHTSDSEQCVILY